MSEVAADTGQRETYRTLLSDPRLLTLLSVSYVGMFNGTVVSPVIPSLAAEFGVSDAQIGLVMSVYTLPGIGFVLILGVISDIYGRRPTLLASLFVLGSAGTAIALVDSFTAVLVLRIIQGLGGAIIMPLVATIIGDIYQGVNSSTAHGLRASVNGVSMLAMPVIVGYLVDISWRFAFYLYGIVFLTSLLVYVYIGDPARGTSSNESLGAEVQTYTRSIAAEMRSGTNSVLVIGGFVRGFTIFTVLTFVPLFAARTHVATPTAVGLIIAMRGVARILVAPLTGTILSKMTHGTAMMGSLLISAAAALAIPFSPNLVWLGLLFGLYSAGDSLFFPAQQDALTTVASDQHRAGLVSSASFLRKVGATISPVLLGLLLAAGGYVPVFATAAALLLGYGGLLLVYLSVEQT